MTTFANCRWGFVFLASMAIFLGACAAGEPDPGLRVAISGNPNTLDPHATSGTLTFQVTRSLYDTLLEPNREGVIVPALAESYEVSEDGLEWRFFLREGVVFHDGSSFSSADVVASLERLLDPDYASPKADEFRVIESLAAPDEFTVVVTLREPYAPFTASLASGWAAMLPAELIADGHNFATRPVGTGPFEFVEWVSDSHVAMTRNEDYWMPGLPTVRNLRFTSITEMPVQEQGLLTGRLDVIDMVGETNLSRIQEAAGVDVRTELSSLVMVLSINNSRPPFDDPLVRRAATHAIDKQAILDIAYAGGHPITTFMDYGDPFYAGPEEPYPYDPARARELLAEAGYTGELSSVIAAPQNYEPHVKAAEMYQEMLGNVGIEVELQLVEWSTWLSDIFFGGDYDLTVIGHTGKLDPDARFSEYVEEGNYVSYVNPDVRALMAEGRQVADQEERERIYTEVQEILARDVPGVFVGSSYRHIGVADRVQGFHMDAKLDTYDFRWVELNAE